MQINVVVRMSLEQIYLSVHDNAFLGSVLELSEGPAFSRSLVGTDSQGPACAQPWNGDVDRLSRSAEHLTSCGAASALEVHVPPRRP